MRGRAPFPRWRRHCQVHPQQSYSIPVNSPKIMGVGNGRRANIAPGFWNLAFLTKKVVFLVSRRKNEISSLLYPLEKFLWLPVEKSANPPWKKSFRCPCVRAGKELCWHHVQFRWYQVQKTMICSSMVLVPLQGHRHPCRHILLH